MITYRFKIYSHKRQRYLKRTINISSQIYNHCIALHKRYYSMFGKTIPKFSLAKHISKLRRRNASWQLVGSQAVQDISERIDRGYRLAFNSKNSRIPTFQKSKKYKSFTLKQSGYKFLGNNKIRISFGRKKITYSFHKSREIQGKIKTMTVKRYPTGELFIIVVTDHVKQSIGIKTGKTAGFDFGLKMFLTSSDKIEIRSPLFFEESLKSIQKYSADLSRKIKGSNHREGARIRLAKNHQRVSNKKKDWMWKLAIRLCDTYDEMYFESLDMESMKKRWGRKISDLAFSTFLEILITVSKYKGKKVDKIDKWYASSKICNNCGFKNSDLRLKDRLWECPKCHTLLNRDLNAANNIHTEGLKLL